MRVLKGVLTYEKRFRVRARRLGILTSCCCASIPYQGKVSPTKVLAEVTSSQDVDHRYKMYPVLINRASISFWKTLLSASLALLSSSLSGCSSPGNAPEPTSLIFSDGTLEYPARCEATPNDHEVPHVYLCNSPIGQLFITGMRQCGIPEKLSYQATTRQLLIGITNLELLNQTPVTIANSKALRSTFRGVLDADTILAATLTQREGDCITDLVVWKVIPSGAGDVQEIEPFNTAATELALMVHPDPLLPRRG